MEFENVHHQREQKNQSFGNGLPTKLRAIYISLVIALLVVGELIRNFYDVTNYKFLCSRFSG